MYLKYVFKYLHFKYCHRWLKRTSNARMPSGNGHLRTMICWGASTPILLPKLADTCSVDASYVPLIDSGGPKPLTEQTILGYHGSRITTPSTTLVLKPYIWMSVAIRHHYDHSHMEAKHWTWDSSGCGNQERVNIGKLLHQSYTKCSWAPAELYGDQTVEERGNKYE